jgi:hypothetical protein
MLIAGSAAAASVTHKVGEITWHPAEFVDRAVVVTGYLLRREKDYVIFSDEPRGKVTGHDLPVSGPGLDQIQPMRKYVITGKFLDHGLAAVNGSRYHLELTAPPEDAKIDLGGHGGGQ